MAGENGAGKSTLLKMMAGILMPDSGEVKLGVKVRRSYFAQHQGEILNFNHTVLESLQESSPGLLRTQQRNILGAFLFSGDDGEKKKFQYYREEKNLVWLWQECFVVVLR
ncbi:MAG: hypothetical protein CM1200mP16_00580 [Nitrospina sp.]|nr:MAG: hypothetical protein CM1200mP16_00580 [Nitrospina sp.]